MNGAGPNWGIITMWPVELGVGGAIQACWNPDDTIIMLRCCWISEVFALSVLGLTFLPSLLCPILPLVVGMSILTLHIRSVYFFYF